MSFSDAPEILFWKASDGVTGILPPTRPKRLSNDSWTLSVRNREELISKSIHLHAINI